MGFLDFVRNKSQKFSVVRRAHDFIVVTKQIVGEQLSSAQCFLIDKYVAAALNTNPPHIKLPILYSGRKTGVANFTKTNVSFWRGIPTSVINYAIAPGCCAVSVVKANKNLFCAKCGGS